MSGILFSVCTINLMGYLGASCMCGIFFRRRMQDALCGAADASTNVCGKPDITPTSCRLSSGTLCRGACLRASGAQAHCTRDRTKARDGHDIYYSPGRPGRLGL
ncbi:hypothetical protein FIBSPDRAFT_34443 [Athelia psychrophila]|uniref:Uncharacterized protein n=1 Tax=Athelia psychrophila TaxID=1759441 RepID=A0A166FUY7_9AGAM|nr:hypothetical protein FIBSPDRAFT_34443 [Fibularhizoctonia sp. CBS 109695]